jgi:hypothetical protein
MKVLVCGGRDFDSYGVVSKVLGDIHQYHGITLLIHGRCRGADMLADAWAKEYGVITYSSAANWKKYGKAAGPMRNRILLTKNPDCVVSFPGGRGTKDMTDKAASAGIKIIRVEQFPNGQYQVIA